MRHQGTSNQGTSNPIVSHQENRCLKKVIHHINRKIMAASFIASFNMFYGKINVCSQMFHLKANRKTLSSYKKWYQGFLK